MSFFNCSSPLSPSLPPPQFPPALQFFALADVFLSSPLVPAYTVAAFAKRLARLSLRAAPAGALLAIAFIHNMIR